jgi:hypothetical protein
LVAIAPTNFDYGDVASVLDRVGEWIWSYADRAKYRDIDLQRLIYGVAKDARPDFHRTDLVDDNKVTRSDGSAERGDTHGLESGQVESVFSYAVRCLEINMGEHSLFTSKRDDFESDARTTLADFIGIKTAGWSRQLIHDALDQRCLSTPWTTCEQNFPRHRRCSNVINTGSSDRWYEHANNLAVLTASVPNWQV